MRSWVFAWICLLTASALGQHYPIVPVSGSPKGIYQLFQDSESRLWLGTINDVYAFDGTNFYSLRPYGFPKEIPNAFAEDSEGGIWIGTQGTAAAGGKDHGGLYRYAAGHVEKVLAGDVLSVAIPSPGIAFAAMGTEVDGRPAYGDLFRLTPNRGAWKAEKLLSATADHMTVDHQGGLLFPCPGGWCEISHDKLTQEPLETSVQHHPGDPMSERVLRDRSGCVWYRSEVHGGYQCPGEAQPTVLPLTLSQGDSSAHLEEGADGNVLMLVPMAYGRPGHLRATVLPSDLDTALLARDGTVWLGRESGLSRMLYPFRLEYWDAQDGAAGMLFEPHFLDGRVAMSSGAGIVQLSQDHRKWERLPGVSGFFREVNAILTDRGEKIVTGNDRTAVFAPDGKLIAESPQSGAWFARTRDRKVWMAGTDGIRELIWKDKSLEFQPAPIPPGTIADFQYDTANDILWACDGRKVLFRKEGAWRTIEQKDGLLDADCGGVDPAPNGDLWVNYRARAYGLVHDPSSNHPVVVNYTRELDQADSDKRSNFLRVDRLNRVWRGNTLVYVSTPEHALEGDWVGFGQDDGIEPLPNPTGLLADPDGSVWFIAGNGIFHFAPPPEFASNLPVAPVFIGGIAAGGGPLALAGTLDRLPRRESVRVHLGSLQFDRRSVLHFRYRVLPDHPEWIAATGGDIELGPLGWGGHRLQVAAQLGRGIWSPTVEQTISVAWPWWLSWPAVSGYLAGVIAGIFGWRRRVRSRKEKLQRELPELSEWRIKVLSPELRVTEGTLLEDRYRVGRLIARGGFAVVTDGWDTQQSQRCAIKILRHDLMNREWITRRFEQEVLALRRIQHPNVVSIFASGILPAGDPYLVMEFIEGLTLRDLLETGGVSLDRIHEYLRQIGSALREIHKHGICHRDLKPENLMLRDGAPASEQVVLIDFSIALVKDPDVTVHGLSRAAGTISYMAPEQAIGYADSSTDIYSLARVVVEMITGKRLTELLPDASMDLPERTFELLESLHLPLSQASMEMLSSALHFDPAKRPKDAWRFAMQIAEDLEPDLRER